MQDLLNTGYGPELIKLMTQALDSAWRQSSGLSKDVELARLVMANAIIEEVDAGVRAREALTASARNALMAAMSVTSERL
jgi:hypothetical protein